MRIEDNQFVYIGNKPTFKVELNNSLYNINRGERFYFPINLPVGKYKDIVKFDEMSISIIEARKNMVKSTFLIKMPNDLKNCILAIPAVRIWRDLHPDSNVVIEANSNIRSYLNIEGIKVYDKYVDNVTKTFDLRTITPTPVQQRTTPSIILYLKAFHLPTIEEYGTPKIENAIIENEYDIIFDTGSIKQNDIDIDSYKKYILETIKEFKYLKIAITGEYIVDDSIKYIHKSDLSKNINKTKLLVTFEDTDSAYYVGSINKSVIIALKPNRITYSKGIAVAALERSLYYIPNIKMLLDRPVEELKVYIKDTLNIATANTIEYDNYKEAKKESKKDNKHDKYFEKNRHKKDKEEVIEINEHKVIYRDDNEQ